MRDGREANLFPLMFLMGGFALLIAGVWRIYHPAALIVAGLALALIGLLGRSS